MNGNKYLKELIQKDIANIRNDSSVYRPFNIQDELKLGVVMEAPIEQLEKLFLIKFEEAKFYKGFVTHKAFAKHEYNEFKERWTTTDVIERIPITKQWLEFIEEKTTIEKVVSKPKDDYHHVADFIYCVDVILVCAEGDVFEFRDGMIKSIWEEMSFFHSGIMKTGKEQWKGLKKRIEKNIHDFHSIISNSKYDSEKMLVLRKAKLKVGELYEDTKQFREKYVLSRGKNNWFFDMYQLVSVLNTYVNKELTECEIIVLDQKTLVNNNSVEIEKVLEFKKEDFKETEDSEPEQAKRGRKQKKIPKFETLVKLEYNLKKDVFLREFKEYTGSQLGELLKRINTEYIKPQDATVLLESYCKFLEIEYSKELYHGMIPYFKERKNMKDEFKKSTIEEALKSAFEIK